MNTTSVGHGSVEALLGVHDRFFGCLTAYLMGWFPGLAARLAFAAVLLPYYLTSALTKPGEGLLGIFAPAAGAFAQILPTIAEQYGYDTTAIPYLPWHIIVILGTLAEFVFPVLVVLGLFTRASALGMVGFIVVQTFVDIAFHGAAPGTLFDGQPTDLLDHRVLWLFPLTVLVVLGPGRVSFDAWLRRFARPTDP